MRIEIPGVLIISDVETTREASQLMADAAPLTAQMLRVLAGENLLQDPDLADVYEKMQTEEPPVHTEEQTEEPPAHTEEQTEEQTEVCPTPDELAKELGMKPTKSATLADGSKGRIGDGVKLPDNTTAIITHTYRGNVIVELLDGIGRQYKSTDLSPNEQTVAEPVLVDNDEDIDDLLERAPFTATASSVGDWKVGERAGENGLVHTLSADGRYMIIEIGDEEQYMLYSMDVDQTDQDPAAMRDRIRTYLASPDIPTSKSKAIVRKYGSSLADIDDARLMDCIEELAAAHA